MPPVTALDKPWPFFLFWRHHFWPKLASSILNFCRRKRSFQWCPDQSDRPNGTLDIDKNAQKVEWKTQSKISCHYTWLLHAKNWTSRWRFLCGVRHLQTAELQTWRLADLQTCRLADLQTCRPADLQTCRLADLQTCRLADLESQHTRSFYPKSFLKSAQPPFRITCLPECPRFRSKQT